MRIIYIFLLISLTKTGNSQVFIQHGAGLYLQENSSLYAQGNFEARDNITGTGKIYLNGDSVQFLNFNGYSLPHLEIDNSSGVKLDGPLSIIRALNLYRGNLSLMGNWLELSTDAVITNDSMSAIETGKVGMVRKKIDNNLAQFLIPLVSGKQYSRLLLNTRGKYSEAYVNVSSIGDASPNKPINVEEYLNNYWKVNRGGISGDLEVSIDYSKFPNTKNNTSPLSGYYWNKNEWLELNSTPSQSNYIHTKITGSGGELFAMNIERLVLYPNPARTHTRLMISSIIAEKATISVFDSRGRVIIVQSVSLHKGLNQVNISVSRLVPGSYSIKVLRTGKEQLVKFIKL